MSFFSSMVLSVAHSNCNGLSASDEFSDVAMLRAVCESSLPLLVVAGVLLVYLSHVALTLVIFYFTLLDSDKGKKAPKRYFCDGLQCFNHEIIIPIFRYIAPVNPICQNYIRRY